MKSTFKLEDCVSISDARVVAHGHGLLTPGRVGESFMKRTGSLLENVNETPKGDQFGRGRTFFDPPFRSSVTGISQIFGLKCSEISGGNLTHENIIFEHLKEDKP